MLWKSNININISLDLIQVCGSTAITCTFLLHSDGNWGGRQTGESSRPKRNPAVTDVNYENEVCNPIPEASETEHKGKKSMHVKKTSLEIVNGANKYQERKCKLFHMDFFPLV